MELWHKVRPGVSMYCPCSRECENFRDPCSSF
nr:MAG TPA: 33 kDa chaperonin [Caudoviricetes sp.]